jgi:hypothetical protein
MKKPTLDGKSLVTPEAVSNELHSTKIGSHDEAFARARTKLSLVLSLARQGFEKQTSPASTIHNLSMRLHQIRRTVHPHVWESLIPIAQNHSVSEFLLQDPFTRWSFEKPYGYSGDAHLLDFIYGHLSVAEEVANASPLGKALYGYTKNASSSVAVRERRDLLTQRVDELATVRGKETEILAIAAGHLREAYNSKALRNGLIKRWIALDQDPLSIGCIARDLRGTSVEAINGSVRGLLTNAYKLARFDFVYAAGLYDYLSQKVAVKLTQRCMEMLNPEGVFMFANFARDISVDGYMETFMDWRLLMRSEVEMWDIINASVDRNIVEARVHFGENRNMLYGILQKRS